MVCSNAAQLISSVLLLRSNQINVLKTSLLGSIISNLLLMTGLCFFFGGINRLEQYFNYNVTQIIATMLFLAVLGLIIPTTSHLLDNGSHRDILALSRGTAVINSIGYGFYLFFQLKSHYVLFLEPNKKSERRDVKGKLKKALPIRFKSKQEVDSAPMAAMTAMGHPSHDEEDDDDDEPETPEPRLSMPVAIAVLITFTVLIGLNTEFATNSIQAMNQKTGISQTFIGFVVLPILSNDVTSILNAMKDEMSLSIALTLERRVQTALLVFPLVVILGWIMHKDALKLEFDGFSVSALFASIIIVGYVVQGGRSNWLSGALLVKVYAIVVLAAYFIKTDVS